ncbi:MAG: phosphopyruvate hydratase [Lachnospiraceae bacterium]|nr:phosphopyruvate hydratase [Lachnospiraceae bacterium]
MPVGACGFEHGLQMCVEVSQALKALLTERIRAGRDDTKQSIWPAFADTETILSLLTEATQKAGYRPGEEIVFALDVAADKLYEKDSQTYRFLAESKRKGREIRRSREEMIAYLEELCRAFPIASIEDGLEENDWEGWKKLTERLGDRVQILGDDLFATNPKRLKKGIREGAANAIVIKVNQIGTLTEAFQTIELAQRNGYQIVVSHRYGETEDTLIADLAVAVGAGQIKAGEPCHQERVAKYNQLLRIEDSLGLSAAYGWG